MNQSMCVHEDFNLLQRFEDQLGLKFWQYSLSYGAANCSKQKICCVSIKKYLICSKYCFEIFRIAAQFSRQESKQTRAKNASYSTNFLRLFHHFQQREFHLSYPSEEVVLHRSSFTHSTTDAPRREFHKLYTSHRISRW